MLNFRKNIEQNKGDAMTINTINPSDNHAKTIIETQRSRDDLAFKGILTTDAIKKHTRNIHGRDRVFTPEVTIHTLLSQVIAADQTCQAAVMQLVAKLAAQGREISANTAAYCKARTRIPEEVLSGLARESAKQIEQQAPRSWSWRGRDVQLVDGSCISMPDTPENQATYPQPGTQKKGWGSRLPV
jgi:hypothetical protein